MNKDELLLSALTVDTAVNEVRAKYQNRTEFIRNALREKIEESKLREAMAELARFKGAAKKKITDKEYEKVREKAFEEISRRLK